MTEHVAATTQNQALNAIVFLYRIVLQQELVGIDAVRAKKSRYLPTVLTHDEVQQVIFYLYGVYKLVGQLLYGSGLRLSEGLQLRVKDIDFAQQQLVIRDRKGKESRVTMLPNRVIEPLQAHLQTVRQFYTSKTSIGATALYIFRLPWSASTLTLIVNGFGSMCFLAIAYRKTRAVV